MGDKSPKGSYFPFLLAEISNIIDVIRVVIDVTVSAIVFIVSILFTSFPFCNYIISHVMTMSIHFVKKIYFKLPRKRSLFFYVHNRRLSVSAMDLSLRF